MEKHYQMIASWTDRALRLPLLLLIINVLVVCIELGIASSELHDDDIGPGRVYPLLVSVRLYIANPVWGASLRTIIILCIKSL